MDQYELRRYGIDLSKVPRMRYVAVVEDVHYPTSEHNCRIRGFDNPTDALKKAEEVAKKTGFSSVDYWIEYDVELAVPEEEQSG